MNLILILFSAHTRTQITKKYSPHTPQNVVSYAHSLNYSKSGPRGRGKNNDAKASNIKEAAP
jgi:hypothetical protein